MSDGLTSRDADDMRDSLTSAPAGAHPPLDYPGYRSTALRHADPAAVLARPQARPS